MSILRRIVQPLKSHKVRVALATVLACFLAGCAAIPAAREVADVSGFKAELAAVHTRVGKIEATTNYDTDVWANRALLAVPLVVSWLFMRMANRRALCEAKKHGYWEQRRTRLGKEEK